MVSSFLLFPRFLEILCKPDVISLDLQRGTGGEKGEGESLPFQNVRALICMPMAHLPVKSENHHFMPIANKAFEIGSFVSASVFRNGSPI